MVRTLVLLQIQERLLHGTNQKVLVTSFNFHFKEALLTFLSRIHFIRTREGGGIKVEVEMEH